MQQLINVTTGDVQSLLDDFASHEAQDVMVKLNEDVRILAMKLHVVRGVACESWMPSKAGRFLSMSDLGW